MRRRKQATKRLRRKMTKIARHDAQTAVRGPSIAELQEQLDIRTREREEALEQQAATAEVLKVISGSTGKLEPVFQTILENSITICEAKFGMFWLTEGHSFRCVALHGTSPAFTELRRREPVFHPNPTLLSPLGRIARSKQLEHVADCRAEQAYIEGDPGFVALVDLAGARTILVVPILRDNELVGAVNIFRQEVRPFTDKQIDLVRNFAAQAVIAIENARLLNELRQRTDDLSESLEQQTATSEVLKVISSSPGDLQPVFDTILANATDLCDARFASLRLCEGDQFRTVSLYNAPATLVEHWRSTPLVRPHPESALGRTALTKQVVQIDDVRKGAAYNKRDPLVVAGADLGGYRTVLTVPMLKEDVLIGVISIYRQEVKTFTDKQIELVQNFAAQAVIAIENTRLLNELRESLQQQTATADVLKVISSSPGDLEPVFETMLANAVRICGAKFGNLFLSEGEGLRAVAFYGAPQAYVEERRRNPVLHPNPATTLGRAMATRQPVQIADIQSYEPDNIDAVRPGTTGVKLAQLAGARTVLAVPMVKESELVGAVVIYRQEVLPFTAKQIELVQNFAAQAVIAIENARLLNELRESLQQQTATAEVLKVISRSTFDLQSVLDTLVESAARLCQADLVSIPRLIGSGFQNVATYGYKPEFRDYIERNPFAADRGTATGRAFLERRTIHMPDVLADPNYTLIEGQKIGDYRAVLAVPLMREGAAIGVLVLARAEPGPFADKQIELATTFADQAVIAIENVRLFESVEARTRELAASLENLRNTQDRLVQTQKLASLGQLTAGIAHEIKNPLNFVNNFSVVSSELIDELQDTLKGPFDEKVRAEIGELAKTLRGNLDKVVQHGKRADAIVKNMLQHSREGAGEHRVVDINGLVEESLNLAWHGSRAEKQGFDVTLERSFDPSAGEADIFPQDITRALLNLISNGFYAAIQRKAETNGGDYVPTLAASTKSLGDRVEIRIRDNGTGIPPDVKAKMFNPFFTTKPTGEGTGLGLSISHDIIVKQHAGSIEVDTQPGEFTEIKVVLPRVAALLPDRS
jgi:two-component system, NtrC family, sensor kinase